MAHIGMTAPRRSERIRQQALNSGFQHTIDLNSGTCDQCCACLLEIDTAGEDGELLGTLSCCQPLHTFHVGCIMTWAEQENTCPQCKLRFSSVGIYDSVGSLVRVSRVMERDQGLLSDGEGSEEDDDIVCLVCKKSDHPESLLLCDGQGGRCKGACHLQCVGLESLPEGDWFCPPCVASLELRRGSTHSTLCQPAVPSREAFDVQLSQQVKLEPSDSEEERVDPPSLDASQVDSQLAVTDISNTAGEAQYSTKTTSIDEQSSVAFDDVGSKISKRKGSKASPREDAKVQHNYTEGGSSSSSSHAIVPYASPQKRTKHEADPFDGLCKKIPKWISRQGLTIRVDLAGKGMRDAVAVVFAKVILPALQQILDGVDPSSGFAVAMHLAGNQLRRPGLAALLEATASAGAHVGWLYVERNRLDNSAAEWLAKWVAEQPGGPPRGLYTSQNKIGDKGASKLLEAVGLCHRPQACSAPTWVELNDNRIRDVNALLDSISARLPICLAMDSSLCSATRCGACDGDFDMPRLHLRGILEQDDGKSVIEEVQVKKEPQTPPVKKIKLESLAPSQLQLVDRKPPSLAPSQLQSVDRKPPIQTTALRKGSFVLPPELPLADTVVATQVPAITPLQDVAAPTASRTQGRGRGRGRGGGRAQAQAHHDPGATEDVPPEVAAKRAEAEKRKAWAQNLGNGMAFDNKLGYDDTIKDAPPSYGLWDLARTKRNNAAKVHEKVLAQVAAGEHDKSARSTTHPTTHGIVDARLAHMNLLRSTQLARANFVQQMPVPAANVTNIVPRMDSDVKRTLPHNQPKDVACSASIPSSKIKEKADASLMRFVMHQLVEKSSRWANLDEHERRLRRSCLCDQLCRLAQAKYKDVVTSTWEVYLRSSKGQERIASWVKKKLTECR